MPRRERDVVRLVQVMVLRRQPEDRYMRMARGRRVMRLPHRRRRLEQGIKRPAQQRHLLPGHDGVRAPPQRRDIRKHLLARAELLVLRLQDPGKRRPPALRNRRLVQHPSIGIRGRGEKRKQRLALLRIIQKQPAGVRKNRDRITLHLLRHGCFDFLFALTFHCQPFPARHRIDEWNG